jgi:hypothetical protein
MKPTKVVVMKEPKFGPSDFQKEIVRLQNEERMPSLQAVANTPAGLMELVRS